MRGKMKGLFGPALAIGMVCSLAACNNKAPEENSSPDSPQTVGDGAPNMDALPAIPKPEQLDSDSPIATRGTIPIPMQGRWGLVPADCTSTAGDAKGLMIVKPTELKFYESVGKLGNVSESSTNSIKANYSFSGEGMNWDREQSMVLENNGKTLVRNEFGQDAAPAPLRYKKCEN